MTDKELAKSFRKQVMDMQEAMKQSNVCVMGEELDKLCPLKHTYGDGLYIREIFMPAGSVIISKIHKYTHPYFVQTGKVYVATEEGTVLIEAPYNGITKAGTKRALFIVEDCTWITVHATKETELSKIEDEIISENFEDFDKFMNMLIEEI